MKIASLIPSGTDIACALGLSQNLVGISHCCDNPLAMHLPVLTRSIINSELPPARIDADVSGAIASGQSLYQTHREQLQKLAPDLILTQTICDVCAVNGQTARRDLPIGARLLNLSATSLEGLWEDIELVARETGQIERAQMLIGKLQSRLETVKNFVATLENRPKVLVLEWSDPPFLGGHWVPEVVEIAGAQHVLSGAKEPSRRATWDEISQAAPEIVILAPCGYNLEETVFQGRGLLENSPLRAMNCAVWATDANALFSRCTSATIRAAELVASILGGNFGVSPHEALRLR